VESPPATPIPDRDDIDSLFAFAKAAGVGKIIYSFRLLETNAALNYAATNAAVAQYIWSHYRSSLDCFALGNEPDLHRVFKQDVSITDFPTYLEKWRRFAAAITNAVPEAKFAGPDGGSGEVNWTTHFAKAGVPSGDVALITEHFYVGGAGRGIEAKEGIDAILSPKWIDANQKLYDKVARHVLADGLPYRFTEANDHYSGGIRNASDTFAGALWALDFLHWWAAHDTRGVDFHNTMWVANDIITLDSSGHAAINPKGYGVKAFDLGSHGGAVPVTVANAGKINLTAYAVRAPEHLFVTIINKEHGVGARAAETTILADDSAQNAAVIYLTAPDGAGAKTGVTLGGAPIVNDAPWSGQWTPLAAQQKGRLVVTVAPVSAAILSITTK
jgi:hypothetical protein